MSEEESKSVFVEWAEITTAHGFVDYVKARSHCGKIVWAFLVIASLTLMLYQIGRTTIAFKDHSWSTSIQDLPPAGKLFSVAFNAPYKKSSFNYSNQYAIRY